jgi:hypothetical protein
MLHCGNATWTQRVVLIQTKESHTCEGRYLSPSRDVSRFSPPSHAPSKEPIVGVANRCFGSFSCWSRTASGSDALAELEAHDAHDVPFKLQLFLTYDLIHSFARGMYHGKGFPRLSSSCETRTLLISISSITSRI